MKPVSTATSESDEEFGTPIDPENGNKGMDEDDFDRLTVYSFNQSGDESSSSNDSPLGAAETRRVRITKLIFFLVLAVAATVTGVTIYRFTSESQEEEFVVQFTGSAEELIVISQLNMENKFTAIESLAISMTTAGLLGNASDNTWPYFTHPNFEVEAGNTRNKMASRFMIWAPLINETDREVWEQYSIEHQDWARTSYTTMGLGDVVPSAITECVFRNEPLDIDESWEPICDFFVHSERIPYFAPIWQTSPPSVEYTNYNGAKHELLIGTMEEVLKTGDAILSQTYFVTSNSDPTRSETSWENLPTSYIIQPVFDTYAKSNVVGFLCAMIPWNYFANILSDEKAGGIYVFMDNPCGSNFTFFVEGSSLEFLGEGDLHDPRYDAYQIVANATNIQTVEECPYTVHLYPSETLESEYKDHTPLISTAIAVSIFVVTALAFVFYDAFVEKRQKKVLHTANQTGAIVNSMFPKSIRERLMDDQVVNKDMQNEQHFGLPFMGSQNKPKSGKSLSAPPMVLQTKPIADYYPCSTLMVTDLVGFTAWSSEREPAQVFTLLETLFNAFDVVAKKHNIFKVETSGDCYVAAAGVPDLMKDHAGQMARFALACQAKMKEVVQHLEVWLGPETGELSMRVGIHSGAVTAGVLRSDKGRFQLFGETMENTHIMESNSAEDSILVSQTTADLLKAAGKFNWLVPSGKTVKLKGSAIAIQTYWLNRKLAKKIQTDNCDAQSSSSTVTDAMIPASAKNSGPSPKEKKERLVEWNVDVLLRLLKMIVAMRGEKSPTHNDANIVTAKFPLDEVKEIIELRKDEKKYQSNPDAVTLSPAIEEQLNHFVSTIAEMYNDNHFHNFDHACHVTQATIKLLSRIVTPEQIDTTTMTYKNQKDASALHAYTYGITSDPIIQFSCAVAAMVHDVDHPGVSNATLVSEGALVAKLYMNKSPAEQNSVDLAWDLLMEDCYTELRECIYADQEELNRFRQLLVNSVMATDIVDKELGALRKVRWNKAFSSEDSPEQEEESEMDAVHRKATIVIEHIVQAADVSHMMQHWHVYLKWNEKFFRECYKVFLDGRMENDPSEGWYKGEIGFFDFYIIPLAKKLKECGVFGVSSDEFLNYAVANRKEWELKGESIVQGYLKYFDGVENLEK